MYDVKNKTVLITGATGGFGTALASRVAAKGGKLVLGDIDERRGAEFASALNRGARTKTAVFRACDVTDFTALRALFEFGLREFGAVHVVINNAGIAEKTRLSADDAGEWRNVLNVDLAAVIEGTRLAFQFIDSKAGGVVVNVASTAGLFPFTPAPVYTAAKFGVVGFSAAISLQANERNVRVNCVAPSFAETNIVKVEVSSEEDARLMSDAVQRIGLVPVSKVVDAMILLIEDDALSGAIATVTPQRGITIRGKSGTTGGIAVPKTADRPVKASL